ncbi:MAG: urea carboxylase-associated family protein [Candidatus Rokubacteria bacterium]|nr:urea carboxylase-associated family protein [Candidatus Rokubacteria bacterium]
MATGSVPGTVLRDEVLEPRSRTAFGVKAGEILRIIDLEGQQVADLVCFCRDDTSEKLSVNNTALLQGTIYISTGHSLLSDRCRKLMTITEDTCGRHDLLAGSCSEGSNRVRYGIADSPNCRSNLEHALKPFGISLREMPYSFNVFMNVALEADGRIAIREPRSKPGDHIDLRAETDLVVGISNCPQERNPCNAFKPTRLRIVVYRAG